jgi:hypothetical protein
MCSFDETSVSNIRTKPAACWPSYGQQQAGKELANDVWHRVGKKLPHNMDISWLAKHGMLALMLSDWTCAAYCPGWQLAGKKLAGKC